MLDPISEARFNNLLVSMFEGQTVVFVSHRFVSTKLADRIVMLKDGKIVEIGTHEELMALDGEYATLYKAQCKKIFINEKELCE